MRRPTYIICESTTCIVHAQIIQKFLRNYCESATRIAARKYPKEINVCVCTTIDSFFVFIQNFYISRKFGLTKNKTFFGGRWGGNVSKNVNYCYIFLKVLEWLSSMSTNRRWFPNRKINDNILIKLIIPFLCFLLLPPTPTPAGNTVPEVNHEKPVI